MTVAPNGRATMPYALANFGVPPWVNVFGGWGLAADWKPTIQAHPGAPLVPDVSFPQPAQPVPPHGVGVLVSIDLPKAPTLPAPLRAALGGETEEKK
jgi:hypothetical protein